MRNLINRKNRGFTLIELLVVIAIIGILAAVVLVSLNSARQRSRDARRLSDIRQIMTALELYYNDVGSYPVEAAAIDITSAQGLSSGVGWDVVANNAGTVYLAAAPTAPTPADGTCDQATENTYRYTSPVGGATYTLTACLGAPTGGFGAPGAAEVILTASQAGLVGN